MFDVALLLATQPLPAGDRVAVVGNSTALGVLVANACAAEGLRLDPARRHRRRRGGRRRSRPRCATRSTTRGSTPSSSCSCRRCSAASADEVAVALRTVAGEQRPSRCCRRSSASRACPAASPPPATTRPRRARCRPTPRPSARCGRWPARCGTRRWRRAPPGAVPALDRRRPGRRARRWCASVLADDAGRPRADARRGRPAARHASASCCRLEAAGGHRARSSSRVFDDRSFGALVSFGIGGVATELLGDRAYAAVPLTDRRRRAS